MPRSVHTSHGLIYSGNFSSTAGNLILHVIIDQHYFHLFLVYTVPCGTMRLLWFGTELCIAQFLWILYCLLWLLNSITIQHLPFFESPISFMKTYHVQTIEQLTIL